MATKLYTELERCILCASGRLRPAVRLAPMPIATPNFKIPAGVSPDEAFAGVPLDLFACEACGHVQVGVIGNPELQYRDYVYQTSLSVGLAEHFASYAREVVASLALESGSLVVEVGSNDGTLLGGFRAAGLRVLGVDPARRIAEMATARGIPTIGDYFGVSVAQRIRAESGPAALIVANNVIANIADLDTFARGIEHLLAADGVFVFETQYCGDVVERVLLDTVYHEHVSYFLTRPTAAWLRRYGLTLFDVVPIPTKGGSFRVFARKAGGRRPIAAAVSDWIEREERLGMFAQPFFDGLTARIAAISAELDAIVGAERSRGRRVGGFGVSVGTSTLLAQFGLTHAIDYLVDDDPNKEPFLSGPGYRIPVVDGARLDAGADDTLVVFAWRYIDAIRRRHPSFRGRFVVPLPRVTVIDAAAGVRYDLPLGV